MKFKAHFCFCRNTIPLHGMSRVYTSQLGAAMMQLGTLPGPCAAVQPCLFCLQVCLAAPAKKEIIFSPTHAGSVAQHSITDLAMSCITPICTWLEGRHTSDAH